MVFLQRICYIYLKDLSILIYDCPEKGIYSNELFHDLFRSSHWRFSIQKVLLKIPQNSQENICARVSFLIKLQASGLQLY